MKTLLLWIFLTLFLFTTGFSQTAVNSAGGDASSPQGSVAYSIGYYSSSVDAVDGSVYTGPQIPVEFYGGCDDAANILYMIPITNTMKWLTYMILCMSYPNVLRKML